MNRVLKVFASGAEQGPIADQYHVVERYDGFVLVEVPATAARKLAREFVVEDVSELYAIPVAAGVVDTSVPRIDSDGTTRAHPAYLRKAALAPGPHHYLVQFIGPIKDAWLRGVKRAGGEPRELYANFTYVVRADEAALAKIVALPYVRWAGHLAHEDRISSALRSSLRGETPSTLPRTRLLPDVYTVEFFGSGDVERGAREARKLGLKVLHREPSASLLVVETAGTQAARRKQLRALSAVHGVRKIRERAVNRPSNDVAAVVMGTVAAMGDPGLGLSGKGETIGICDTGIDTGNPNAIHPDFAGRLAYVKSYPITPDFTPYVNNPGGNDGPADLDSGHGTHVSGSVLGSGAASAMLPGQVAPIRGLAYNAKLVFQAVEQEIKWKNPSDQQQYGRYLLAGIPADLKTIFGDAYARGARIHSNSWGGGDPGSYDEQCRQLDKYVWEHKDFCILVAAGNDGTDMDGDGRINPMSVTSPGTAKNCITVGACENKRTAFNTETYGKWWPGDYPAPPYKADPMANDPNQVVAFSSRGPTKQNRVKPEIVAPGTFILSTRSTMIAPNNTAWAAFPPSRLYFYMGGTSMATPLIAGAVALVREYLRKKGISEPDRGAAQGGADRRRDAAAELRRDQRGPRQPPGLRATQPRRGAEPAGAGDGAVHRGQAGSRDRPGQVAQPHREVERRASPHRARLHGRARAVARQQPQPDRDGARRAQVRRERPQERLADDRLEQQRGGRPGRQAGRGHLARGRRRLERLQRPAGLRPRLDRALLDRSVSGAADSANSPGARSLRSVPSRA